MAPSQAAQQRDDQADASGPSPRRLDQSVSSRLTCDGIDCFGLSSLSESHSVLNDTHDLEVRATGGLVLRPHYEPLQPYQTRLLKLSQIDDQLQIGLLVADLTLSEGLKLADSQEIVKYTALSHAWSVESASVSVNCNGTTIHLQQSVYAALVELSRGKSEAYLWADTICINQHDQIEKAQQVSVMLDIYLKADSVMAWLGVERDDSSLAMNMLGILGRTYSTVLPGSHHGVCKQMLVRTYTAIRKLYDRRWLYRTWIRQEIYAARSIEVACGRQCLAWEAFLDGHNALQ